MASRVAEEAKEFREFLERLRSEPSYWKHFTILQFTTAMARLMKIQQPRVSGKKLAELLGVSSPTVSKALSGGENLTVETMARMAAVLDAVVHIHIAKKGVAVQWVEEPEASTLQPTRTLQIGAGDYSYLNSNAVVWRAGFCLPLGTEMPARSIMQANRVPETGTLPYVLPETGDTYAAGPH
ncbi:MAG TPA: helix-turn-helix domain-containing protein [Thermoanaerobaculia bacterium]|jgi:transcriptional regulator with XRE-family HTH domain|nr:helix-turn-helix domain-containing protein [Thermoanaerobaculia bacterium]